MASLLSLHVPVWFLFLIVLKTSARPNDWLVDQVQTQVELIKDRSFISLTNGLITRSFMAEESGSFGTIDYRSEVASRSILRTLLPEAFITLDGTVYPIGGLTQQGIHSFLNRSAYNLTMLPNSYQFVNYSTSSPKARYPWTPGNRYAPKNVDWPPKGLTLTVVFQAPKNVSNPAHRNTYVYVNYEMYVGIPLLAKWITVKTTDSVQVRVDAIQIEYLGTQKPYAPLSLSPMAHPWEHDTSALTESWLYVEADTPHVGNIAWDLDPVSGNSPGSDQPVLKCSYGRGPGVVLSTKQPSRYSSKSYMSTDSPIVMSFDTYHVLELITDSYDLERVALSRHRMTRLLAPQTQENPIFFHCTDSSPSGFKNAVDQMAAVGFEMFIYSFGSGFRLESTDAAYLKQIASDVQYAKSKGIEVGGYDLIDLERGHGGYGGNVGDQWDAVDVNNGQFTKDACFASGWYDKIRQIIFNFVNNTGLSNFETDGPYGGGACASKNHSHHVDVEDSVYWQTRLQGELYADLRAKNVYIHQPDNYFYWGGSKTGMGYNENQYSLPRWEDLSVSRQGMYDDTYHFIPTQGWMFLPLVQYHGGGNAAEFEPLSDHLIEYEWGLAQYFGYGVAACYRGPRLYDSDKTQALVSKWVSFYKKYRDILISDIVHVRRPDMQDYDCILHVNPNLENCGLAMIFNPTIIPMTKNISLPLYYTGISDKAIVMKEGENPVDYTLNRDYTIDISITVAANSVTWYLIKDASKHTNLGTVVEL